MWNIDNNNKVKKNIIAYMEPPKLQIPILFLLALMQGPERISKLVQDFHVPKHDETWSVNQKNAIKKSVIAFLQQ